MWQRAPKAGVEWESAKCPRASSAGGTSELNSWSPLERLCLASFTRTINGKIISTWRYRCREVTEYCISESAPKLNQRLAARHQDLSACTLRPPPPWCIIRIVSCFKSSELSSTRLFKLASPAKSSRRLLGFGGGALRAAFSTRLPRRNIKMAWRCSGSTNKELIENMWKHKLISDARVKEAFMKVF